MVNDGLLSIRDAAHYLGMSESWLHHAVLAALLPSFKIGRRRLVRKSDLDAYLDRHRCRGVHEEGENVVGVL